MLHFGTITKKRGYSALFLLYYILNYFFFKVVRVQHPTLLRPQDSQAVQMNTGRGHGRDILEVV
jgi:hypothetical protein